MEVYKDIKNWEGKYQVSNFGNVKSLDRTKTMRKGIIAKVPGRILKPFSDGNGYLTVRFSNGSKQRIDQPCYKVHRLVTEAFIYNLYNKPWINHKDANKHNNNLNNLEWCTPQENNLHAMKLGLRDSSFKRGQDNHESKLTNQDVIEIKYLLKNTKVDGVEIGKWYGVDKSLISLIRLNKNWTHIKI